MIANLTALFIWAIFIFGLFYAINYLDDHKRKRKLGLGGFYCNVIPTTGGVCGKCGSRNISSGSSIPDKCNNCGAWEYPDGKWQ